MRADAAVKLKIGTSDEMIAKASENFLNWKTTDISESIQDVLEGNLREVIGQMELRKMVNDRQEFASKVQDNVAPDLEKMGLEVIAFTVQSFSDEGGVIDSNNNIRYTDTYSFHNHLYNIANNQNHQHSHNKQYYHLRL